MTDLTTGPSTAPGPPGGRRCQNLYIYRIIGQTGYPADRPNCPPGAKVPLTVQFSGLDAVSNEPVSGNSLEWHQPPWQAGNVLSYPGNLAQFQAYEPGLDQFSTDSTWVTNQTALIEKTTWNTGTTDSQTMSFDQSYSFNDTFSVSGTVDEVLDNQSFKASTSASRSFGFSTLHTAVTTLGKSTGIGVQKPGSFESILLQLCRHAVHLWSMSSPARRCSLPHWPSQRPSWRRC